MLKDLLLALKHAKTPKEKEKAYRNLAKLGMDRMTADIVLSEMEDDEDVSTQ